MASVGRTPVCQCGSYNVIKKFNGYLCAKCFDILRSDDSIIECEWEDVVEPVFPCKGVELIKGALLGT